MARAQPPGQPPPLVKCPSCGRTSSFDKSNLFRPFCSERCKLLDLGHWASEQYRVPGEDALPSPQETARTGSQARNGHN